MFFSCERKASEFPLHEATDEGEGWTILRERKLQKKGIWQVRMRLRPKWRLLHRRGEERPDVGRETS